MNKYALLVFLLIQGILAIYLGDSYWHPQKYVYTFGGDGAFIYFNMIFHTLYGDGFLLENMNFPKHESIFMTDSQAAFSLLFTNIQDLIPDFFTPERVIAWMHRGHYLLIGLAGVYALKLLALFKIENVLSTIASIFIVLLSPMMIRLTAGHFGLAYPFVFTFTIYFICQFYLKKKINTPMMVAFVLVILFFGLNNFYIGIINILLSLLVSLFILNYKLLRKKAIILATLSISLIAILYLCIHMTDPGMDRIEIQWGYLSNSVNIASLIIPPTGLLHVLLSKFIVLKATVGESWINLGMATLFVFPVLFLFAFIKKTEIKSKSHITIFIAFCFAALIMLIYASAIFYRVPILKTHFFDKIGLLTMFKASARFAWPIFFVANFAFIYLLNLVGKDWHFKLKYMIFGVIFLIWGIETHHYLQHKVFIPMHQNPYTSETINQYQKVLNDANINLNEYQAMYTIPVMEGWNDKFQIVPNFQAEYNSILLSMSTGLPMINGMLSRIGVTDAAKAIQFSSNPLIGKELVENLDANRKVLLVVSKDVEELQVGEQFLVDQSTLLSEQAMYELRSLDLRKIDNENLRKELYNQATTQGQKDDFHMHHSFEDATSEVHFAGKNSLEITIDQKIFEATVPDTIMGTFEISVYTMLDKHMFGTPQFFVETYDADGKMEQSLNFNAYQTRDISSNWARVSAPIEIHPNTSVVQLRVSAVNQTFFVDEICLRPLDTNVSFTLNETNEFLYNNYKWEVR